MPETYIIFITSNDVLKGGLPVYTIERTIQETGELFGDKAHIVYVNGSHRGNDEVGWLTVKIIVRCTILRLQKESDILRKNRKE